MLICLSFYTLLFFTLATGQAAHASDWHNALSLQGYTGLLNIPTAEVTNEGRLNILYSNQKESHWRSLTSREESYMFSAGLFPFVEVGGRLTDAPGVPVMDLSANVKVQLPISAKQFYIPDLAFGAQDLGGASRHLQTTYLVASEKLWKFRLSVGYGFGPDRLEGVFGGGEFQAFDWLYLLGEYDTRETNIGARVITPYVLGIPVNLQLTAKTTVDEGPKKVEFGIGLQFPLGMDRHNRSPLQKGDPSAEPFSPSLPASPTATPGVVDDATAPSASDTPRAAMDKPAPGLEVVLAKLTGDGFQNVRVGSGDRLVVVEYENARYNHNELDALGVVIGTVADTMPEQDAALRLVIKKKGIRVLQLTAPLAKFREFLNDPAKAAELNEALAITSNVTEDPAVRFIVGGANPSWLHSTLVMYPGLKTFVGTEVGAFDYLVSLKLDYYLNLWKGAVLNARWDGPVFWSENFNNGEPFRSFRTGSRFERLMLFQAIKPAPSLLINLGGGMILHEAYGTLNELMWTPGSGNHRFTLKQAYVSSDNGVSGTRKNEVFLGSYRYYFDLLDLHLTGTGGKFFDNDTGFTIEMKRFFGDTAFSVYYKNSRTASGEHVEVGGVQVAFPLTFRRDMKPYLVQVKGSDEWSYAQETKLVARGASNYVGTSIGVNPQPSYNLEHIFFNRDRLGETYIRKNLLWLRDGYITYRSR